MKKIYGYAFAAATMLLASCSSDAPEVNDDPIIEGEGGYICLSLDGVAGTRADDDVQSVKYYLYHGATPVEYSVAKVLTSATGGMVLKVDKVPDNVIAVVNSDVVYTGTLTDGNLADKDTAPVMSSAVRYNGAAESYVTRIPANNIYKTIANAEASAPIVVNVDRVVAKVTVNAKDVTPVINTQFNGYKIEFIPEYAFVNGIAKSTPVKKQLLMPTGDVVKIQGNDIDLNKMQHSTGSSHWSRTGFAWTQTQHFSLKGDAAGNKDRVQTEAQIFENCPTTANGAKRDYTHIIVAGHYKLTATGNLPAIPENKTFWTFGSKDGKAVVYTDETELKVAMGGTATSKLVPIRGGDDPNRNVVAYYLENGNKSITCVRYGDGCVYYAEPIETAITDGEGDAAVTTTYGKGIVRNHKYVINVLSISGLGTAVAEPETPIIPEDPSKDVDEYFVNLSVKVNPFVKVDDQNVKWE